MNEQKYYQVGKIVNTHGLRGEVRVVAITDFPDERFKKGQRLYIMTKSQPVAVTVESARRQKGMWLIKFAEFNDINQVENLKALICALMQLINNNWIMMNIIITILLECKLLITIAMK